MVQGQEYVYLHTHVHIYICIYSHRLESFIRAQSQTLADHSGSVDDRAYHYKVYMYIYTYVCMVYMYIYSYTLYTCI